MPPAALTPIPGPTVRRISSTSWAAAPPGPKPVEVLTKSAPAARAHQQARTFSSSVRSAHSKITLITAPLRRAAATPPRMSCSTNSSSPDFNAPTLMTISISSAPSLTASSVSATFTVESVAPSGKPTTVQTFTGAPRRAAAAGGAPGGLFTPGGEPNQRGGQTTGAGGHHLAGFVGAGLDAAGVAAGADQLVNLEPAQLAQRPLGQVGEDLPGDGFDQCFQFLLGHRGSGLDRGHDADVGQVAVALAVVEPVADHESVQALEPHLLHP